MVFSVSPNHMLVNEAALMLKKVDLHWLAMHLPSIVFPVPEKKHVEFTLDVAKVSSHWQYDTLNQGPLKQVYKHKMEGELFKSFAVYGGLVLVKTVLMSPLTSRFRLKNSASFDF